VRSVRRRRRGWLVASVVRRSSRMRSRYETIPVELHALMEFGMMINAYFLCSIFFAKAVFWYLRDIKF
jgi:hypothetical protein